MSKAIYVLDAMPINCAMCPIIQCNKEVFRPTLAGRPDDCPLKETPERIPVEEAEIDALGISYIQGWNACLKEIGGCNDA